MKSRAGKLTAFVIQQETFYYLTNALKRVANNLFIANKIERDWDSDTFKQRLH
jgi:hypothetical protein